MVAVRNISPRGDLDVPLIGRTVAAGAVVDVDDAHATRLLEQVDNWQLADPPAPALAEPVPALAEPVPALAAPAPVLPVASPPAPDPLPVASEGAPELSIASSDASAPADTQGVPA